MLKTVGTRLNRERAAAEFLEAAGLAHLAAPSISSREVARGSGPRSLFGPAAISDDPAVGRSEAAKARLRSAGRVVVGGASDGFQTTAKEQGNGDHETAVSQKVVRHRKPPIPAL
jgi:hypothetical protein